MKKILASVLTAAMMLSMGTAVWAENSKTYDEDNNLITAQPDAEGNYTDAHTVTFTKVYENPNAGVSPAEIFTFKIDKDNVTDQAVTVTKDNMPVPTVGTAEYKEGDAGKVIIEGTNVNYVLKKDIVVTLPEYEGVGIYSYIITENKGTMAGVTYYEGQIKLIVTVVQDGDGQYRVAAVHTEDMTDEDAEKIDYFMNYYHSGELAVSKTVTGNLGDRTKDFIVKVTFKAPEGKTVGAPITYTDDGTDKTITVEDMKDGVETVKITLKHDETVTFKNIPYGVTYSIVEDDYTGDGYDKPAYRYGEDTYSGFNPAVDTAITVPDLDNVIDTANESAGITNNKGTTVDTGISVDSIPYIAILGVVAIGGTGFIVSKKRHSED